MHEGATEVASGKKDPHAAMELYEHAMDPTAERKVVVEMRECVAALRPEAEAPLCKLAPWGANRELPVGFLSREQLRGFGSIVR